MFHTTLIPIAGILIVSHGKWIQVITYLKTKTKMNLTTYLYIKDIGLRREMHERSDYLIEV